MVLASHYIIKDVLNLLESGKKDRLEEVCNIYRNRYREDEELLDVFDSVLSHITSEVETDPETLRNKLSELVASRRMEISGGRRLYAK